MGRATVTDQEIPLEAESAVAGSDVSWFVDGRFAGRQGQDRPLWWLPEPGVHEFMVMDGGGRSATRRLEVRVR